MLPSLLYIEYAGIFISTTVPESITELSPISYPSSRATLPPKKKVVSYNYSAKTSLCNRGRHMLKHKIKIINLYFFTYQAIIANSYPALRGNRATIIKKVLSPILRTAPFSTKTRNPDLI